MSTTAREIIVNNTDSSIKYSLNPPWYLVEDKSEIPTLYPELHQTDSNGTLRLEFNGTQISLFGGTQHIENSQAKDVHRTWNCFVDGEIYYTPSNMNNQAFCSVQDLADTAHVLTLNATREDQPFWVDYISYTPSGSVSLDNSLIRVSNVDPDIDYGVGWGPLGDGNITTAAGSWMSFNFIGQSLSLFGVIDYTNIAPVASYVVDGTPYPSIPTPGSVLSLNKPFFETNNLSSGLHSINVTFEGDRSSTPLTLAYMLVQNGTVVDPIPSPTPTSPSSTTSNSHTNVHIGAIVGGSLAAIILLLLLLLVFLFIRHRKRTRESKTMTIRPSFSKSVADKAGPQPVYDKRPQHPYKSLDAYHDGIDKKSSYYGGYQTWGQIKEMEAVSKSKIRDSYM